MARVPKTDPNIYQVDLVAGLFGAFMLVWISGAQETEYPGDQVDPPTIAVLELTAIIDDGGSKSVYSLVPAEAAKAACLTKEYLTTVGLADVSDVDCPAVVEPQPFKGMNTASIAFYVGRDCQSSRSTPRRQWQYSYSLVTGSLALPGFGIRGFFERSRTKGSEVLPYFETSPYDSTKSLASFIVEANAAIEAQGDVSILICDPQPAPRQAVSLFVVDDKLIDIWSTPSFDLVTRLEAIDQLLVTGEGALGPTLWTNDLVDSRDAARVMVPEKWGDATLTATLCAYRDGSKQCFAASGVSIASKTVKLIRVPDA